MSEASRNPVRMNRVFNRVSELAAKLKLANLQPQFAACRHQLNGGSESIDVAVFGRFKAGKSSFLNHLTGRNVLPIGVVPLTAVITRLQFGPTERAEVRFANGEQKTILDDIRLYVSEDQNPNNERRVASVEVQLPAFRPFVPLQFVDTPGLGSAFSHNTEATRDWLPNVGAALVAISSDAPLSERDLELLEELRQYTPKIVLLLTKADLLSDSQRLEVLDFVRTQLRRRFNHDGGARSPLRSANGQDSIFDAKRHVQNEEFCQELPVFFYSIRPGEGHLKTDLEKKLLLPLAQNRDAAASQIARYKVLSLATQTLNYLQIALAAATQADSSRQALGEKLADERRQFDLFRSELRAFSRELSASALDGYLARLHPVQQALQKKITQICVNNFRVGIFDSRKCSMPGAAGSTNSSRAN